jgi:uncharacterized protein YkwD
MGRLRVAVAVIFLVLFLVAIQKKPLPPAPEPAPQQCPPPKQIKRVIGNEFELEVIRLTNRERTSRGLRPLEIVPSLMTDARNWSNVQATRGRMFHSRMGHGENVAWNYNTPESVMTAWMNSPGHRRNILNPRYTMIGVGGVTGRNGAIYSTQCFE